MSIVIITGSSGLVSSETVNFFTRAVEAPLPKKITQNRNKNIIQKNNK